MQPLCEVDRATLNVGSLQQLTFSAQLKSGGFVSESGLFAYGSACWFNRKKLFGNDADHAFRPPY